MWLLLFVSVLWAVSPGLIKHLLGDLPSAAIATVRLGLTFLVFAPFLRPRLLEKSTAAWLAGIGAIQFGAMYLLYLQAFKHLQGHEVFLFTILTPIYIVLLDAAIDNRLVPRHAAAALLAAAGAGVLVWRGVGTPGAMTGFLLVQGSNLCFAAGQIAYKRTRPALERIQSDAPLFAWLALGGFAATALVSAPIVDWGAFAPTPTQWLVLVFLGVVASGAGFFLWNLGLTKVNAGALAVMNNAKIPLGVVASLLIFREPTSPWKLVASVALLGAAVWLAQSDKRGAERGED